MNKQTRIAATRLVLTAVILNSIEASGSISNGRALKMYSEAVHIKSFGGQKGGTSPAYGPESCMKTTQLRVAQMMIYIRWSVLSPTEFPQFMS